MPRTKRARMDRVLGHLVRAQNALRREDDAYLARLLEQAITHRAATVVSGQPRTSGPPVDKRIVKAIEHLVANIGDWRMTVSDLAGAAGMSQFHFSRVFASVTGQPPKAFLRLRRLELAKELLAHRQGMPIIQVALACGFANQSSFTDVFTQQYGIAPGKFRKMSAQQQSPR